MKLTIQKIKDYICSCFYRNIAKKKVYILCANDRFNYGDLLFPYILKHYFKGAFDKFIICSTTSSDMSLKGALKTKDFAVLTKMSALSFNTLIVGGGECIFCNWRDILNYVSDNVLDKDFLPPTVYPFTIKKSELRNLNCIIYNSVGCHQLNERIQLYESESNKQILESADYIAVRDSPTSLGMSKMNIVHHLCADSAILMSKIFDNVYLSLASSPQVKNIQTQRYLFFQIGFVHLKGKAKQYADILTNVYKEKNIHICFCPIGTARGHDDPQALAEIARYLSPEVSYTMIENPSIWDIMSLISRTEIYVGTSLHGAITAMSYRIPLIAYGPRKLQVYIETWYDDTPGEYSFVSIDNMENAIKRRMDTHFVISPEQQMQTVLDSFDRMKMIIQNV